MKNKLRQIFLLCVLAFGSIIGVPINPRDVEELLAGMNQAKEKTIQESSDSGDSDTTDGRREEFQQEHAMDEREQSATKS